MEPAPVAVPPNLAWSKNIVRILARLDDDTRRTFSYLGPANAVLHVSTPDGDCGTVASRALFGRPAPRDSDDPRVSPRFPSGIHKRIRLSRGNGASQSVIMEFQTNLIHAGCTTPPAAVEASFSYLLHSANNDKGAVYRSGFSLNVPNIVLSARTSFPVSRDFLEAQEWCNYSEKFPGIAVIDSRLRNRITPELYPSKAGSPKEMNLIIPGICDVEKDLPATLTLLAELLAPCRPPSP